MKLTRINAVLLDSSEGERLVGFYRDVLGIPLRDESHGSDLHWGCFLNDVHFAIHHVPGLVAQRNPCAISFETGDVDGALEEIRAAGHFIEQEPHNRPFGRLAAIRDPDGNLVYLHNYGA